MYMYTQECFCVADLSEAAVGARDNDVAARVLAHRDQIDSCHNTTQPTRKVETLPLFKYSRVQRPYRGTVLYI